MPETPLVVEYIQGYYNTVDETIRRNINRARDVGNFCTGFLGVVGGGSAYVLMRDLGWCAAQRTIFTLASGGAFISFFAAVLFTFFYVKILRRKKPFPGLVDPSQIMLPITESTLQKFEEERYEYYADIRQKANKKGWMYSWAFWLMIVGFVAYGAAATLIAVFEWG